MKLEKSFLVKTWEVDDTPLLWVELVHRGDVEKIRELTGFTYSGHVFVCRNQHTTFYRNKLSEDAMTKFGNAHFGNATLAREFCEKTRDAEKQLETLVASFRNPLSGKSNGELAVLLEKFVDFYGLFVAFYHLTRPECYKELMELAKSKLPEPKDILLSKALSGEEVKQVNLDASLKELINNLRAVGKRRFEMHETWVDSFKKADPLFEEIGMRLGLSKLETKNCLSKELCEALLEGKKIDSKEIEKRLSAFAFVYGKDDSFEVSCESELLGEFSEETEAELENIRGQTANPGFARGRVTILKEVLEGDLSKKMAEMREGDVLVATNTSPDMMAAIRKASAIVTDEGGMLCHAAIVSRELRIPCVIGTKHATKVLKDGDVVEVDASKGIVRRL